MRNGKKKMDNQILLFSLVFGVASLCPASGEFMDVLGLPNGYNRMARPNKGGEPDKIKFHQVITRLYRLDESEKYAEVG